jgi:hypothetical protein
MKVMLPERFCGPPDSANGGYTAGVLAQHLGRRGAAEITLRQPPSLDTPLDVVPTHRGVELRDGDTVVAEAVTTTIELGLPAAVDWDEAVAAAETSLFRDENRHPFPSCFVCGPQRGEGDGLRIFAGRVGQSELFAAPWIPSEVSDEVVWAALDCPSSAPAFIDEQDRGPFVLGRIAAHVEHGPVVGERHVIVSWETGRDGRKVFTGVAIYGPDGVPMAWARATWIEIAQS